MTQTRQPHGRLITLEGGEGGGKSTQGRFLADALAEIGIDCLLSREPGGVPIAEEIRHLLVTQRQEPFDPVSEVLLHSAARREHWIKALKPALEAGRWVVCDRFSDSTYAYQGAALGVDSSIISFLTATATDQRKPDLTIILDVAPEKGLARTQTRGGADRYESLGMTYHQTVRQSFLDIGHDEAERCTIIDAGGQMMNVRDAVFSAVENRFSISLPR